MKVVEIASLGPGPHACMVLADLGADVIRIQRPGPDPFALGADDVLARGRPSVVLDLKHPAAVATVLDLVEQADVMVEGMRPGSMERLGLGPQDCWQRRPELVYGRMTGWGQDGPWAHAAGHDLTYVAVTGALDGFGQDPRRPQFPSNVVGDFGGGSTYLVIGVLAALLEARSSGRGQVVDAAIVDGAAHLNALASALLAAGRLSEPRGSNLLDGGAPFYDLYETADGRHLAVGALEPQFYAELLRLLHLDDVPDRQDPRQWGALRQRLAEAIAAEPLAYWHNVFAGTDACAAPVLTLREAPDHPHLAARGVFVEVAGVVQPAPAPRFSRTPSALGATPAAVAGQHTREALRAWGVRDVDALLEAGAAVQAD